MTRPPLDDRDHEGFTRLMVAAFHGELSHVTALLAAGASINLATAGGSTALILAANAKHEPVALELLSRGADPTQVTSAGWRALDFAILHNQAQLALAILSYLHTPDYFTPDGRTPLHAAARLGRTDIAISLLAHGANVRALSIDRLRWSPYQFAKAAGHKRLARVLVAAGGLPSTDTQWSLLRTAFRPLDRYVRRWLAHKASTEHFSGVTVYFFHGEDTARALDLIREATDLLRTKAPRHFANLVGHLAGIVVVPQIPGAIASASEEYCSLSMDKALSPATTPVILAGVIAHEACHARLARASRHGGDFTRIRAEYICLRAELDALQSCDAAEHEAKRALSDLAADPSAFAIAAMRRTVFANVLTALGLRR